MLTLDPGDTVEIIVRHKGVPYAKTFTVPDGRFAHPLICRLALELVYDIEEDLEE